MWPLYFPYLLYPITAISVRIDHRLLRSRSDNRSVSSCECHNLLSMESWELHQYCWSMNWWNCTDHNMVGWTNERCCFHCSGFQTGEPWFLIRAVHGYQIIPGEYHFLIYEAPEMLMYFEVHIFWGYVGSDTCSDDYQHYGCCTLHYGGTNMFNLLNVYFLIILWFIICTCFTKTYLGRVAMSWIAYTINTFFVIKFRYLDF